MARHKFALPHLKNAKGLLTPYENTRAGFVQMALEKSQRASTIVTEARTLAEKAKLVKAPRDLMGISGIRGALLTAAGISDKAAGHFDPVTHDETIEKFVERYLVPAGLGFREELVYRFLLTRGDSLGGKMRNIVGVLAQRRFNDVLIAQFRHARIPFHYRTAVSRGWISSNAKSELPRLEDIKALTWSTERGGRVMAYNQKIPLVGNNIDMSLLACEKAQFSKEVLNRPDQFLALGELKGGVDPAGADEHWKTARTALDRIRAGFEKKGHAPALFFVGAAIEQAMASEIWDWLNEGRLDNAANLTVDAHLSALCDWIVGL